MRIRSLLLVACFLWTWSAAFVGRRVGWAERGRSRETACVAQAEAFPSIRPLQQFGSYCWDPENLPVKDTRDVSVADVKQGLRNSDRQPKTVLDPKRLRWPCYLQKSLAPQEVPSKFPYKPGFLGALVVSQQRGLDLDHVDFVLGGSGCEVLVKRVIDQREEETKYLVQRVPGTRAIALGKSKVYTQDFSRFGFQFERLMTGEPLEGLHDLKLHEAIQLVDIGGWRVLLVAEIDAVNAEGRPVEIKSGNPKYFGLKLVLQMISSGAGTLLRADRRGSVVNGALRVPLVELVRNIESQKVQDADQRLVAALEQLRAVTGDGTSELGFASDGSLTFKSSDENLLPDALVVKELLGLK